MMIRNIIKNSLSNFILENNIDSELDEGRRLKYTDEELIDTACQYKTMGDFLKNEKNLYQAASRRDMLFKIRSKCKYKNVGNLMQRMVYMYIWEKNISAVYFGLTCDEDRRYEEHVGEVDNAEVAPNCKTGSNSAVRDFIKKHGMFDRYFAITDGYINAIMAAAGEICLIDHYRNDPEWKDKIIVVNRSKGGELGGRCSVNFGKLTRDSEKILSNYFESPEDLKQKYPKDFEYWAKSGQRKKMMNQKLNKRFFEDAPYSIEELINLIKKYDKEIDFQEENPLAYKSARRNKVIDIVFPKNKLFKNVETNKTYDNLKNVVEDLNIDFEDALNIFKRNQNIPKLNIELIDIGNLNENNILRTSIKKILNEETSPDEIRKGIDISVKMLKQDYPFVVGWEYSDLPDTYTYKIYVSLELDFSRAMEFYNLKPHPRYGKFIVDAIEDRETFPYPFSMMNYEDEGFDVDEVFKLQSDLTEIYEDIPNKLKMSQGSRAVFDQNKPKELAVDNYIFIS